MDDMMARRLPDLQIEERSDDELADLVRAICDEQVRREKAFKAEGKRAVIAVAKKYGLKVSFESESRRGRPRKAGTN